MGWRISSDSRGRVGIVGSGIAVLDRVGREFPVELMISRAQRETVICLMPFSTTCSERKSTGEALGLGRADPSFVRKKSRRRLPLHVRGATSGLRRRDARIYGYASRGRFLRTPPPICSPRRSSAATSWTGSPWKGSSSITRQAPEGRRLSPGAGELHPRAPRERRGGNPRGGRSSTSPSASSSRSSSVRRRRWRRSGSSPAASPTTSTTS